MNGAITARFEAQDRQISNLKDSLGRLTGLFGQTVKVLSQLVKTQDGTQTELQREDSEELVRDGRERLRMGSERLHLYENTKGLLDMDSRQIQNFVERGA